MSPSDLAMNTLPEKLYTAQQVRELERLLIEDKGVAATTLMERAGACVFDILRARYPEASRLCILCGGGNNGGDGYVAARLAKEYGLDVRLLSVAKPQSLNGDEVRRCAKAFEEVGAIEDIQEVAPLIEAHVIVDALLGTGLNRQVEGVLAALVHHINGTGTPVLSVDVPSGLDADTGACMGVAVEADATVTFIGLKRGMFTGYGPALCGEVFFRDLGAYADVNTPTHLIAHSVIGESLPVRPRDHHKGDHGHVLIIGGDHGYAGAAILAGTAAVRAGAGLTSIASRNEHAQTVALNRPELMTVPATSSRDLTAVLSRVNVVAIGPGLGQTHWAMELLAKVLQSRLTLVVDADALNLLATEPQHRGNWILTPHPGEAARLLGVSTKAVQANRFAAVTALQEKFGGSIVLKGPGSLITSGDDQIYLNPSGNPGMASGGMGDVLTGVIAGFVAQGMTLHQAAVTGTYLHGHAADICARKGERGMLAGDLFPVIRSLVNPR